MLVTAHSKGELIASDHPSWAKLDWAIDAAREGDPDALDLIALEAIRLRDTQ